MKFNIKILDSTRSFQKNLEKAANKIMPQIIRARDLSGSLLQVESQRTIMDQLIEGPDISAEWRAWKAQHGFDTRILLRAHIMVNMIRFKRYSTSPQSVVGGVTVLDRSYPSTSRLLGRARSRRILNSKQSMGMTRAKPKSGTHSNISVKTVAMYHEGGLGGMLRRSFFKPTYSREGEKVLKIFYDAIQQALAPLT